MKRNVSKVLAVMLTVALLATSFVMLSSTPVFAADAVTTEEITIGNNVYTVTDKANAYDDIMSAVAQTQRFDSSTLDEWGENNPTTDFSNSVVDFGDDGWSVTGGFSNATSEEPNAYMSGDTEGYEQIAVAPNALYSAHIYYSASLIFDSSKMWINTGSYRGGTAIVSLVYTAPKAGDVVLYDNNGYLTADYMCCDACWFEGQNKLEIYHNDTKVWPLSDETDNIFSAEADKVYITDLAPITVAKGDTITLQFTDETDESGNKRRTPVLTDIEAAYIYEAPPIDVEEVTVHGQKLVAEKGGVYRAYDSYMALINNNFEDDTAIDFTDTVWNVEGSMSTWGNETPEYDEHNGYKKFSVCSYMNNSAFFEVRFLSDRMLVNPGHNQGEFQGRIGLNFVAPKTGTVSLFNFTGDIYGDADKSDYLPQGSWWDNEKTLLTFTVKKNGVEIWPNGAEADNTIYWPDSDWILKYPALNNVSVTKGDIITFEYKVNTGSMAHIKTDPVVVYTHEHDWAETEVTKEATYVIPGEKKTACNTCTTVKTEAVYVEEAPIVYGDISYDVAADELTIPFSYSESFLKDLIASKDWNPFLQFHYNVCGKDYKLSANLFFYEYEDGGVITLSGFNAERLSEDVVVWFTLGWGGNPADYTQPWPAYGSWLSPEGFNTDTTKTIDVVAAASAEDQAKANALLSAFETADTTVVNGQVEDTATLVSNTISVDIKNATASLRFVASQGLITKLNELERVDRTVTLYVTIGGVEFDGIEIETLTKVTMVNISGLSFEQLNGKITVQLGFDYEGTENDFPTDVIEFNCGEIITDADTDVAIAFAAYMN